MNNKGINLFLAYAPEDKDYREKIGKHLSVLKERGFLNEFCLSEVTPGANADLEIRTMMNQAKIILLLISSDFLASEECQRLEDLAFSMKMRNDAVVVPVLLRPCLYDESYHQLEILPGGKKPISDTNAWGSEDEALTRVAERIKDLVVKIRTAEAPSPVAETQATTSPAASIPNSTAPEKPSYQKAFVILPLLLLVGLIFFGISYLSKRSNKTIPIQEATITLVDTLAAESALIKVPDFRGKSWSEVSQKLTELGIVNVERVASSSCSQKPGQIVNQRPKPGTEMAKDAELKLEIISSPKRIKAPSIGRENLKILKNGQRTRKAAWAFKNTGVAFSLSGTECTKGKITVDHPLGGTKIHYLKAGQEGSNSRFFGLGDITVTFSSDDPAARLSVRIY